MPELKSAPAKNCYKAYDIWLYTEKSSAIKSLKKHNAPSVHGDKQWDSSYLLMDYFSQHPLKKKTRVLDVGCGWGPTSVYLAANGATVTGLDVDNDVFSFLHVQADLNKVKITTRQGDMKSMKHSDLTDVDVIVGGDICFWDELAVEWLSLLKRAAKAGVKKLVLADPGRQPFFDLINKCTKRWPVEILNWYALEPKKFTGVLLVVSLQE